ncbi:PAQR family membrane homeostasis protein TrhA [Epilithonimonas hungarica]|uniref:Hemolysin III n=1 Tax=Epilithonimonas hungarica TaxID=454006 RepID=A0A1G7SU43_9FLAO|nr:hemolysin III family protein [Epilithonimonas hungarica]SDG26488.1 hemolysin III [Epilithonimonas hungarica]
MPKKNRKKEEFYNVITHGVGAVLSVVALILMIIYSAISGSTIAIVCSLVFGLSLITLYSASTIYHAVYKLKWKKICQRIDHLSIYILIAGTYTPIALLGLKGVWGWAMFGVIWGLAIIGFIFKFSPLRYNEKISLSLYAIMGWTAIIAIKPMIENLSAGALTFIILGGLCYTFGIYFYAKDRKPFYHPIWHLFVLGGSIMHFCAVFFFILP